MKYPAKFEADVEAGGYVVTFRDIPEAVTQGDDEEDALMMAEDVLASAMDFYIEDQRLVPLPSPLEEGERWVALPASVATKVSQLNHMLQSRLTQ